MTKHETNDYNLQKLKQVYKTLDNMNLMTIPANELCSVVDNMHCEIGKVINYLEFLKISMIEDEKENEIG
jgi:hypothetical protein